VTTLPRAALLSAAAIVLAALLVPTALAQAPQPGVTVTLDTTSVELGVSNSTTLTGTVAYTDAAPAIPGAGATDGAVDLSVTAPAGWTATVDPASFSLAPGQSATFTVVLTAPAAGESATLEATVAASAQSPDGRTATASAPIAIAFVVPPPPVVPWYQTPLGMAGIGLAALALVGVVAGVAIRRRNVRLAAERAEAERAAYLDRETGITLAVAGGPLQYGHKREVVYRLAITNASKRPRVAVLDVVEVTNGWRASAQVSKIPLSVGETQHATLVVTPDAVITPGDVAKVTVRVKPEEAREKDERLTLEVVAPKHGSPTDPHYRIVTVHREGANNQLARR